MCELELARRTPQEWRTLLRKVACYAHGVGPRLFGDTLRYRETGSQITSLTLGFVRGSRKGYVFRDGHILHYYFLCGACLRTAVALQATGGARDGRQLPPPGADDEAPEALTEGAALAFLQRRQCLDEFLAFTRQRKLKGKLRAYGAGFARYGAEAWDVERIARDLRVTPATIGRYRSQLRGFLEDFEVERERSRRR
jgi:hypothetical protein